MEIEPSKYAWQKLFAEVIETNEPYLSYTDEDKVWISEFLMESMKRLSPDMFYLNLVRLNRTTRWGQMFQCFNYLFCVYVKLRDTIKLETICNDSSFYELEQLVKYKYKNSIMNEIEQSKIILNMTMDRILTNGNQIPNNILKSTVQIQCHDSVCFFNPTVEIYNNQIGDGMVQVIEDKVYSLYLPHLLIIIAKNEINPQSGTKFSQSTIDSVKNKYFIEYVLTLEYLKFLDQVKEL